VPKKTNQKKGTRVIWSFGQLCAPQSCLNFKNSLRSDSLKSFKGIFSSAHQMPMGKHFNYAHSRGNQESEPARLRGRALWARIFTVLFV